MKLSIDISSCVNGWRVDILNDAAGTNLWPQIDRQNFDTSKEAFDHVAAFIKANMITRPPYNTMEVC